jgi:ribosomal protein S1
LDNENQPRENDPWAEAESRYQPEQEVQGIVTRVTQLGVFVQLEPGIEGIMYGFELGPGNTALARYRPGQEIRLYVQTVDANRKRLELTPRQEHIPGLLADQALPVELQRQKRPVNLPDLAEFPLPEMLFKADEQNCPTCHQAVQRSWKYCVYCGGSLRRQCAACGNIQPDLPAARFCYECGKPL